MMKKSKAGLFATLSTLICSQVMASGVEFSADAVQISPNRPAVEARMYVGRDGVRTEFEHNGVKVIEVTSLVKGKQYLLLPAEKKYRERDIPGYILKKLKGANSNNPCDVVENAECKLLGNEKVNGVSTEKWQLSRSENGQKMRSLHWVDVKRKLPLREFFPDGTVSELRLLGSEQINGRKVEKWQVTINRANGQGMSSRQWYDPEMKMMIREELQGGYVREMRNISIGKQDSKLFTLPHGYELEKTRPVQQQGATPPQYPPR